MRKPNKTYTVLVMSDGGTSVRKFRVTTRRVKIAIYGLASLIVLLVGATVAAYFFGSRFGDEATRLSTVERENHDLRQRLGQANREVGRVQSKVKAVSTALDKVSRYASKLRRLTHLSDPARGLAMGPVAVGGPNRTEAWLVELEEDGETLDTGRERREMRVGIITRSVAALKQKTQDTQTLIESLEKYFKDREVLLTSTPSIWPTRGSFASKFGMRKDPISGAPSFHKGIDIYAERGTPVMAPADGTVAFSAHRGGYGLHVVVDHGFGVKTLYGHLSKSVVKVGQKVKRGDPLGRVGSTGRSTGPHLHYEVRIHGIPQNPFRYILD